MKSRAHIVISGSVQGVFFRSSLRNQARVRGLTGWVKNMKSGQVEALIEGDRDRIKDLIEYCKEGPPGASVGDVTVKWEEGESDNFTMFEIR